MKVEYQEILAIEECGNGEVWDISFQKQHDFLNNEANFIANNIIVHNSHAGGVILSPVPLHKVCPMHVTADKVNDEKMIATQFSMADVESLGLIKFDVLGISTKTSVAYTQKLIKDRYNKEIDLSHLPLDDKQTLNLLKSGKTTGIFQLESTPMKHTLKEISVDTFDDLVATIALFRPGPMQYIPEFAARKHKKIPVKYDHPIMEKITASTYGIMVYQEQIQKVYVQMAGLSATDGYKFIKGCAKKNPDFIKKAKDSFINGCMKNNIDKNIADKVFGDMEKFANYAFNKAHAVSYGYESYKSAFLKTHYTIEFICAQLTVESVRRQFDTVAEYEEDAVKNFGIKIKPPDLNNSKLEYRIIDEKTIVQPINLKGIGDKAAEDIVKNQPYNESDIFYDFAIRVGSCVNSRALDAMIDLGLFKRTKKDKARLMADFEQIRKDIKKTKSKPANDLFG